MAIPQLTLGIVLAGIASLSNVVGGYLAVRFHTPDPKRIRQVIAVGAGFMLAAALLDLIPHIGEEAPELLGLVLVGYFIVHALEAVMSHPGEHGHGIGTAETIEAEVAHLHPGGTLAAGFGLIAHAFFDGVAIISGFLVGEAVGILLFVSISLHKLSIGFSLSTLMRSAGYSAKRATGGAAGLSAATLLGALAVISVGSISAVFADVFVALSAGSILYVGASDMIPLTHSGEGRTQATWLTIAAAALFYGILYFLRGLGLG